MINPIIVAIDVDDPNVAKSIVKNLSGHVGGFKIGPRLTLKLDFQLLRTMAEKGILFFDHKFMDIPSTTVASVRAAAQLGALWVTVHALNGPECLKELAAVEKEIKRNRPEFRVLVVTVLTSFTEKTLPPIWKPETISESVAALAQSAFDAGLNSVVCSPHEIKMLKQKKNEAFLVVPGIRPVGADLDDQQRVATPEQAMSDGASALVIGRPIIEAPDPLTMIKRILNAL